MKIYLAYSNISFGSFSSLTLHLYWIEASYSLENNMGGFSTKRELGSSLDLNPLDISFVGVGF